MEPIVFIPEPCPVKWNSMSSSDQGRHCQVCATEVVDFSKMPLEDITNYFKSRPTEKICGRYHQRHTNHATPVMKWINGVEQKLLQFRWRRAAVIAASVLLFFSNCARRKLLGAPGKTTDSPRRVSAVMPEAKPLS
ncbi:MAG: hypothetical protein JST26_16045 [Bacteroidetes bacterium]|nr:hypothetical protein [Bacteroidota bacterium]